jgi:hypothetical protein
MLTGMEPLKRNSGRLACGLMAKASKAGDEAPSRSGPLFGDFRYQLKTALERQGLTVTEYARRVGHDNSGLVCAVFAGRRKVPLEDIHDWLEPLELTEAEYGGIYLAALRDFAPRYVFDIINTAESILQMMAEGIIADRKSRGLTTSPFPRLAESLGRRPGRSGGGSPDSGRAKP